MQTAAATADPSNSADNATTTTTETAMASFQLAVGYLKEMNELLPMVEIEDDNAANNPRTKAVLSFLESLVGICDATRVYDNHHTGANGPQQLQQQQQQQQQQQYAPATDKVHPALA